MTLWGVCVRRHGAISWINYESTTIGKKTLCELQDRETQERRARDLQEPAP